MNDRKLREDVLEALDWEPSVDSSDIGVTVEKDVVTLTGHVPTYLQRDTIGKLVRHVRGVKGLVMKVEVRPASGMGMSDEDVAVRVVNSLRWSISVPPDQVQVAVQDGVVTLTGEVDHHFERKGAESVIRPLIGVREISNLITVRERPVPADLKRRIEAALKRDAEIESQGISVEVSGNKVILRGKVSDLHERQVLEAAIWAAPGVATIDDRLTFG
jgi:osmotically-inducible protein OsmY